MSDMDPDARSLISQAEGVDSPSQSDKERIRSRLALQIGIAAVGVAAGATAKASATGVTAKVGGALAGSGGAALAAKIIAGVAVASLVALGVSALGRSDLSTTHQVPDPSTMSGPGSGGPTATAAALSAAAPGESESKDESTTSGSANGAGATAGNVTQPSNPPGPPQRSSVGTSGAASPVGAPPVAQAPSAPSAWTAPAEGEAALLRKAEAAIEAGDGVRALALLDTHEKRYPDGMLADQREAERVLAICAIGKVPAARASAERYLAAHPRSSQADRIRRACGVP